MRDEEENTVAILELEADDDSDAETHDPEEDETTLIREPRGGKPALPFHEPEQTQVFEAQGVQGPGQDEMTLDAVFPAPGGALPFRAGSPPHLDPLDDEAPPEPVYLGGLSLRVGAEIQYALWERRLSREAIFARHSLDEPTWREHCEARDRALREEARHGGNALQLAWLRALRSAGKLGAWT